MTLEVVFAVIFRLIFVYLTACVILSESVALRAVLRRVELFVKEHRKAMRAEQKARGRVQLVAPTEAGSPNGTNDLFHNKCYFYKIKSIRT